MNEYALKNSGYRIEKNLALKFRIPAINLSQEAKQRLKWMDYYYDHAENAALTCRYFGISRKTFYKWYQRYNPRYLQGLEAKSRKPRHYRRSQKDMEYGSKVKILRTSYPTWSKYKIGAKLRQEGANISDSSVGYILKQKNLLDQNIVKKRKRNVQRNLNKIRIKDVEISLKNPGALVQMDTKEIRRNGQETRYQFTAIDCFSRVRKLKGYGSKTAFCSKDFLDTVLKSFPFKVQAILTDNGSEFNKDFDQACQELQIKHYWTDSNSPNQNAYVESSHSIDQKEFYEVAYLGIGVSGMNESLLEWEHIYNDIRPHGSLNFLAPQKFLESVIMS